MGARWARLGVGVVVLGGALVVGGVWGGLVACALVVVGVLGGVVVVVWWVLRRVLLGCWLLGWVVLQELRHKRRGRARTRAPDL